MHCKFRGNLDQQCSQKQERLEKNMGEIFLVNYIPAITQQLSDIFKKLNV